MPLAESMMPTHAYRVYGLRVRTEIACPGLPDDPHPDRAPDVSIRLLPPLAQAAPPLENGYYEVRPGTFRLAVQGVGRYLVEQGSRISVEPLAGAAPEEICLFLMGSVLGALLYQRGLFPLHGCAVETRWGAMIFVGPQGVGKSTLAAQFFRRGYRLLSDDVCAVDFSHGALSVLPALAHLRLCADAYLRLDSPSGAAFHVDKFIVPMHDRYCPHPVPLRAVHVLADSAHATPSFALLHGFDRVRQLLHNLYRPQFLQGQQTQSRLMHAALHIAQDASVAAVSRRRDPHQLDGFIDFLEASWSTHFASSSQAERK